RSQPPIRTQLPPLSELMGNELPPPMGPPHSSLNPTPYSHMSRPPSHPLHPSDSPHSNPALPQPGEPSRLSDPAYRTPPPPGPYSDDAYNRGPAPYPNGQGPIYPSQADRQSSYAYPPPPPPPPLPPHYTNAPPTSFPQQYGHPDSAYN